MCHVMFKMDQNRRQVANLEEHHGKEQDSEDIAGLTGFNIESCPRFSSIRDNNRNIASKLTNGQYSASLKKLVLCFVFETAPQHSCVEEDCGQIQDYYWKEMKQSHSGTAVVLVWCSSPGCWIYARVVFHDMATSYNKHEWSDIGLRTESHYIMYYENHDNWKVIRRERAVGNHVIITYCCYTFKILFGHKHDIT